MTTTSDLSESDFGTCETALIQLLYEDSHGLEAINDTRKKTPSKMFERLLNRHVMVIVYLHYHVVASVFNNFFLRSDNCLLDVC